MGAGKMRGVWGREKGGKPKRYERVSRLNDILSSDALFLLLHNSTSGRANENVERIEGRVGQGRKGKKKKKELRERGARDIPFLEGEELRLEMSTPNGSQTTSLLELSAYLDAKHLVYYDDVLRKWSESPHYMFSLGGQRVLGSSESEETTREQSLCSGRVLIQLEWAREWGKRGESASSPSLASLSHWETMRRSTISSHKYS